MQFSGCAEVLLRTVSSEMYIVLDYLWYYINNEFGPNSVGWIKTNQAHYNRHSFIFGTSQTNLKTCVKVNVKSRIFEQNWNYVCLHVLCHPLLPCMSVKRYICEVGPHGLHSLIKCNFWGCDKKKVFVWERERDETAKQFQQTVGNVRPYSQWEGKKWSTSICLSNTICVLSHRHTSGQHTHTHAQTHSSAPLQRVVRSEGL